MYIIFFRIWDKEIIIDFIKENNTEKASLQLRKFTPKDMCFCFGALERRVDIYTSS
jgi:hypothetical protein